MFHLFTKINVMRGSYSLTQFVPTPGNSRYGSVDRKWPRATRDRAFFTNWVNSDIKSWRSRLSNPPRKFVENCQWMLLADAVSYTKWCLNVGRCLYSMMFMWRWAFWGISRYKWPLWLSRVRTRTCAVPVLRFCCWRLRGGVQQSGMIWSSSVRFFIFYTLR